MEIKKTDLAYVAGLFDGEGSVSIVKGTKANNYHLQISLGSTDEWICQSLKMMFGGSVSLKNKASEHIHACWQWSMGSRQAYNMLLLILPYLHIKRPQVEIAIKFQEAKTGRGFGKGSNKFLTEKERALREVQRLLVMGMNKPTGGAGKNIISK